MKLISPSDPEQPVPQAAGDQAPPARPKRKRRTPDPERTRATRTMIQSYFALATLAHAGADLRGRWLDLLLESPGRPERARAFVGAIARDLMGAAATVSCLLQELEQAIQDRAAVDQLVGKPRKKRRP